MHDPIRAFGSLNMCLEDLSSTLCSLPIDALHSVATFLQIEEWRNFGLVNRDASLACREVLKKIKMHAFHCAVEVLTTWVSAFFIIRCCVVHHIPFDVNFRSCFIRDGSCIFL